MARQPHKVWRVLVGSLDDRKSTGRVRFSELSERAVYHIEAKGQGKRAEVKALQAAADDGVPNPVVLSIEWENRPLIGRGDGIAQ